MAGNLLLSILQKRKKVIECRKHQQTDSKGNNETTNSSLPSAGSTVVSSSSLGSSTRSEAPDTPAENDPLSRARNSTFDCRTPISASNVTFSMVETVTSGWNEIKSVPNWKEVGGVLLLRGIIRRAPECAVMYGLPMGTPYDDPSLSHNHDFILKGVAAVTGFDQAVQSLGPDLEPLEDQLAELGRKHRAHGCTPSQWPIVGDALFDILRMVLTEARFTTEVQHHDWVMLYNFMGYHMIRGLLDGVEPMVAVAEL